MKIIASVIQILKDYVDHFAYPPTKWYFILSCLGLAITCYFISRRGKDVFGIKSLFRFLFPKEIMLHPSTRNDFLYALSFPIIAGLLFMPALALSTAGLTYGGTKFALLNTLGEHSFALPQSDFIGIFFVIAFTISMTLGADLCFYFHH